MEIEELGEPAITGFEGSFGKDTGDMLVKCGVSLAWQTLITLGYDFEAAARDSAGSDDLWERKQAIYPYALLCALRQFLGIGLPNKEELADIVFSHPDKFNNQYVEWQLRDTVIQAVLDTVSALNSTVDPATEPRLRNQAGLFAWVEFLENDPELLKKEGLHKPFNPANYVAR
jgi:hypothetical protein